MRILITNDDGINAPGLKVAEQIAAEIAGPDGELWVVAPEFEVSAISHAITYNGPIRMSEHAPRRVALSGTPADCVIVAMGRLMPSPPDLVISGVNRGHNVAEDVVYSGTVGGAMEGALQGVRSIALSQFYRSGPDAPDDLFDAARGLGADIVRRVLNAPWPDDVFYNVNFPAVRRDQVKGVRVAPQGRREAGVYEAVRQDSPNGKPLEWIRHRLVNLSADPESDAPLCVSGWATVTPLRPDLNAGDAMDGARAAVES
jgi:5'-nucleotidase